ncbi:DUF7344 domain-containing protein [Natronoglomus mannanivorans]|uniref:DUF7344 domain-containing protein n=1 Tax=Natronoglomus mannanivorans TaxID=2979990 RepID=UPI003CCDF05D
MWTIRSSSSSASYSDRAWTISTTRATSSAPNCPSKTTENDRDGTDVSRGSSVVSDIDSDDRPSEVRAVVAVLSDREPPIALSDLSAAVTSREAETESNARSAAPIETVRTTLYHVHLPKLDVSGIVDDTETNAVTAVRTTQLESIASRLDGAD